MRWVIKCGITTRYTRLVQCFRCGCFFVCCVSLAWPQFLSTWQIVIHARHILNIKYCPLSHRVHAAASHRIASTRIFLLLSTAGAMIRARRASSSLKRVTTRHTFATRFISCRVYGVEYAACIHICKAIIERELRCGGMRFVVSYDVSRYREMTRYVHPFGREKRHSTLVRRVLRIR